MHDLQMRKIIQCNEWSMQMNNKDPKRSEVAISSPSDILTLSFSLSLGRKEK